MRTPMIIKRLLLLALALTTAVVLTGCYVSPVDIAGEDLTPGGQGGFNVLPSNAPTSAVSTGNPIVHLSTTMVTTPTPTMAVVTPTPTASAAYATLQSGSQGAEVLALQQKLITLGYLTSKADGIFGTGTQAALIAYQKAHNLVADGIANAATLSLLFGDSTAMTVTPTVSPTSSVLKKGASGDAVRAVQTRLKTLGYLTSSADGDFGEATEKAVIAFQKNNSLNADGIVGTTTLAKLNSSSAISAAASPTTAVLKLGASGDAVRTVQKRLKTLGYLTSSADGDFGEATEKAVIAFQKTNGLNADGIVGASTLAKLNSSSAKKATATATATPRVSDNVYLKQGSTGSDVTAMQKRLISLGYLTGTANGVFDACTLAGVKAFQNRCMSYTDGIAGPSTLSTLYSSAARTTSTPAAVIGVTVKTGMSGSAVSAVQRALKSLGYYSSSVDGDFGSTTETAVRVFQAANGLRVDGEAGAGTLNILFSEDAKRYSASVTPTPTPRSSRVSPTPAGAKGEYRVVTPPPSGDYVTLERYDGGDLVRELQQELKDQGYYSGSVDGCYGEDTVNAVMTFQASHGLTVDGKAGPATLRTLYEGDYPATS